MIADDIDTELRLQSEVARLNEVVSFLNQEVEFHKESYLNLCGRIGNAPVLLKIIEDRWQEESKMNDALTERLAVLEGRLPSINPGYGAIEPGMKWPVSDNSVAELSIEQENLKVLMKELIDG